MIILGLGSNLGSQLDNLRLAIKLLRDTSQITIKKISPVYQSQALLLENSPIDWNKTYLNLALGCESNLTPEQLLHVIKKIEMAMGRTSLDKWAPRIIDIDILAWDQLIYQQHALQIPHADLTTRPFALWPLLDLIPDWQHPQQDISAIVKNWGSRYAGNAPFNTQQIPHRIDTPALVGILNITTDSFSDGGKFNDPEKALAHAQELFLQGAAIIDIGAESTRPGATPLTAAQEWIVLKPILETIQQQWHKQFFKPKISIDTYHHQTAEQAIALGVDWINDVTGFENDAMCNVLANTLVKCVVMHNLGVPPNQKNVLSAQPEVSEQVLTWAKQRFAKLINSGIKQEQIIFDPGIGFGKTPAQSLNLINNIFKFRELNIPILIGHSRKSCLTLFNQHQPSERDFETALLSFHLTQQTTDYLRVHNVALNAQALKVAAELSAS